MGIINVITRIIHTGIRYTVCGTKVLITTFLRSGPFMKHFIIFIIKTWFIILRIVAVDRLFILIFTVLQRNRMPYKLSLGTTKGHFLPYTFFIIPGNFIPFAVVIRIFIG